MVKADKEYIVNLKGVVDRIDISSNKFRVIDYKTGLVEASDIKIKALEELLEPHKKLKLFIDNVRLPVFEKS